MWSSMVYEVLEIEEGERGRSMVVPCRNVRQRRGQYIQMGVQVCA